MEKLISELEPDVMKVFYIWLEELAEHGEEICMGRGWSFNRYEEEQMLPHQKAKQIPIEYFKLPTTVQYTNTSGNAQIEQQVIHKSH